MMVIDALFPAAAVITTFWVALLVPTVVDANVKVAGVRAAVIEPTGATVVLKVYANGPPVAGAVEVQFKVPAKVPATVPV